MYIPILQPVFIVSVKYGIDTSYYQHKKVDIQDVIHLLRDTRLVSKAASFYLN